MYTYNNSQGSVWYLNHKLVTLRGGMEQPIYYFSKDARPEGCELPNGYQVVENKRSGVPFLKKIR